jgi:hypothetical protein
MAASCYWGGQSTRLNRIKIDIFIMYNAMLATDTQKILGLIPVRLDVAVVVPFSLDPAISDVDGR